MINSEFSKENMLFIALSVWMTTTIVTSMIFWSETRKFLFVSIFMILFVFLGLQIKVEYITDKFNTFEFLDNSLYIITALISSIYILVHDIIDYKKLSYKTNGTTIERIIITDKESKYATYKFVADIFLFLPIVLIIAFTFIDMSAMNMYVNIFIKLLFIGFTAGAIIFTNLKHDFVQNKLTDDIGIDNTTDSYDTDNTELQDHIDEYHS